MRPVPVVTTLLALVTLTLGVPAAVAAPEPAARDEQEARIDLNGDGFDDLAVGAPLEDVGTLVDVGAVTVFNAAGGGTLTRDPPYTQGSGGLGGTAEELDLFGIALE